MKFLRLVLVFLVLLCFSLSQVRVAHADWELYYNEFVSFGGDEYFDYSGDVNWSEDIVELGGSFTGSTGDEYSYVGVKRDRITRVHYRWTGGGTPTAINKVDVSWFVNLTTHPYSVSSASGYVLGNIFYTYSSYANVSETGTNTMYVVVNGTDAYIDVSWGYNAGVGADRDYPDGGNASAGVGFGTSTPYYAP